MKAAVRRILLSPGLSSSGNLGEKGWSPSLCGGGGQSEEGRGPWAKMECQCSLVATNTLRAHDPSVNDHICKMRIKTPAS